MGSWYFSLKHLQILIIIVADKSRPKTMSFVGSEDYIRAQFEEYILALLASVKYDNFLQEHSIPPQEANVLPEIGSSQSIFQRH
jgi:hypothetical protein